MCVVTYMQLREALREVEGQLRRIGTQLEGGAEGGGGAAPAGASIKWDLEALSERLSREL